MAELRLTEEQVRTAVAAIDAKKLMDVLGHAAKVGGLAALKDVSANLDKLEIGMFSPLVKLGLDNFIKIVESLVFPPAPTPTPAPPGPTPTPVNPTDVVIDVK